MKRLLVVLGLGLMVLGFYAIAGTSDRFDELTLQQKREIVARWGRGAVVELDRKVGEAIDIYVTLADTGFDDTNDAEHMPLALPYTRAAWHGARGFLLYADGQTERANAAFAKAADHPELFYGQLAAEELGTSISTVPRR